MTNKKTYRVAPEIKADILKRIKEDGVTVSILADTDNSRFRPPAAVTADRIVYYPFLL